MIIDKIKFTEEEQREREKLNKEYMSAVAVVRETMPDDDNLTFTQAMNVDGVTDAVIRLTSVNELLKRQKEEAERRHMKELGTSDAILAEANEIIDALEKKDFQDFIKPLRKAKQIARQKGQIKEDKDFQNLTKRYNYDFRSAYAFVMSQVHPYHVALKDLGEEKEIIDNDKPMMVTYSELLEILSIWKVKDSFGYTPPSERKKKETVSLKDELTAVEDINVSNLYNKSVSDGVTRALESSIGKRPTKTEPVEQYPIIETEYGQLKLQLGTDLTESRNQTIITSETILFLNMLIEKLVVQIPSLKVYKETELDNVLDKLKDEKIRTVSLTLGEYREIRKLKESKKESKDTITYALKSVGSIKADLGGGRQYYMFSSEPQEMYKAGNIEAVFNLDWCKHLYTEESKLTNFPKALYTINLQKHQHVVPLWLWLRENYEVNKTKQNPHTNRVRIITTIGKVQTLSDIYEDEKKSGQGRYWQRVIEPLFKNLDALRDIYGLLDYEILDKNKKKVTGSKFNKMSMKEKLECWIRYELTEYPQWNAPEQLTTKQTPKDTEK